MAIAGTGVDWREAGIGYAWVWRGMTLSKMRRQRLVDPPPAIWRHGSRHHTRVGFRELMGLGWERIRRRHHSRSWVRSRRGRIWEVSVCGWRGWGNTRRVGISAENDAVGTSSRIVHDRRVRGRLRAGEGGRGSRRRSRAIGGRIERWGKLEGRALLAGLWSGVLLLTRAGLTKLSRRFLVGLRRRSSKFTLCGNSQRPGRERFQAGRE